MKRLLLLALLALPLSVSGQTATNLSVRFTLETVTAGVTNSSNLNLNLSAATKKDAQRIDGLNFAYASYVATFGTNAPTLNFHQWWRANYQDFIQGYANQKQAADNLVLLGKLQKLLTSESDLLSNADLNSLATIAAKAP